MMRLAFALAGSLTLAAGLAGPATADEQPGTAWKEPPARTRTVYRTRTIVRRVVVERPVPVYRTRPVVRVVERPVPVYRTRRVVREVVVERPVYLRPRPYFGGPYGPPPYAYGPPPFRPAFAYGYGPRFGPYPPFRPRPIGWGWGPGPFF